MGHYGKIEAVIGGVMLAFICLLVFVAAVSRFLGTPIIWSVDVAGLLLPWLCFIGASKALREKAHLGVDILARLLPPLPRLTLETVIALISVALYVALAIYGWQLADGNRPRILGDSGISYFWVTLAIPAGCVLLTASTLLNLVEAWRHRADGRLVFTRTGASADVHTEL